MSRALGEEGVLAKTETLERRYGWAKAAELYEQALLAAEKKDVLTIDRSSLSGIDRL